LFVELLALKSKVMSIWGKFDEIFNLKV
jgi:hypothetical protein